MGERRKVVMPGRSSPRAPERLLAGRYRLIHPIGSGGTSTVHLAEDATAKQRVAVKVLTADRESAPAEVERFLREAQGTSRIRHPNVIEISDFGETPAGAPFFVMEHLDGENLGELLARAGKLSWSRAAGFAVQIARGLAAAHDAGVIHRDLKPENCIRVPRDGDPDFIKIIDFGIAKLRGSERLTQTGLFVGTPHYMSPERARGGTIDHRVDIYALGVIMFELLTGKVPFDGVNVMEVLTAHAYDSLPALSKVAPGLELPEGAEAVVRKALRKKAEHRFETMAEFAAAIMAVSEGSGSTLVLGDDDAEGRPAVDGPMEFAGSSAALEREAVLADEEAADEAQAGELVSARPAPARSPAPDRHRAWLIAAALVLLAVGGLFLLFSTVELGHAPPGLIR